MGGGGEDVLRFAGGLHLPRGVAEEVVSAPQGEVPVLAPLCLAGLGRLGLFRQLGVGEARGGCRGLLSLFPLLRGL